MLLRCLEACDNDAHVILAVSRLFWRGRREGRARRGTSLLTRPRRGFRRDRKEEKARSWCNRAVTLDPDLGDAWGNYYAFELQHGVPAQRDPWGCWEPSWSRLWTFP